MPHTLTIRAASTHLDQKWQPLYMCDHIIIAGSELSLATACGWVCSHARMVSHRVGIVSSTCQTRESKGCVIVVLCFKKHIACACLGHDDVEGI